MSGREDEEDKDDEGQNDELELSREIDILDSVFLSIMFDLVVAYDSRQNNTVCL